MGADAIGKEVFTHRQSGGLPMDNRLTSCLVDKSESTSVDHQF